MKLIHRTAKTAALALAVVFAAATSAAFGQGIPEVGLTLYGMVTNDGAPLRSGKLTWTYSPASGGDDVVVSVRLGVYTLGGEDFSYVIRIPAETAWNGSGVSTNTLPVTAAPVSYSRTADIGGVLGALSGGGAITDDTFSRAERGNVTRIDLEFIGAVVPLPAEPSSPTPVDGASDVYRLLTLYWADAENAVTYDVYIWPQGESRPGTPDAADLAASDYTLAEPLAPTTTYLWQVVARNEAGETAGPAWRFTTGELIEPPTPTPMPTDTPVPTPVATETPSPTPSETPTPSPTPRSAIDDLIIHFYTVILERSPGEGEIGAWRDGYFNFMVSLDVGVRFIPSEMGRQFFLSDEYADKNTDDTQFITQNYNAFLYREPSQSEINGWVPVANRREAMSIFSRSEEFLERINGMFPGLEGDPARNFVTTMYLGLLDRLPDSGGLEYAAGRFEETTLHRALAKQMGRDVTRSQEYIDKRTTNYLRVESLYRAYLGRFPNNNEIDYWTGVLERGESDLDEMIEIFGDSLEFWNILVSYFPDAYQG